jgi:hypothetical protein
MVKTLQALGTHNDCLFKMKAEVHGYRLYVFNRETLLDNQTFVSNEEAFDEKIADLFRKQAKMTRDGPE